MQHKILSGNTAYKRKRFIRSPYINLINET